MTEKHAIVLFDGDCMLCNRCISWIIKNDQSAYFKFASLQSKVAKTFLDAKNRPIPNSIVLIENEKIHLRSSAILLIIERLDNPWPLLQILAIVPKRWRDWGYDTLAQNRFKLFGKTDTCSLLTKKHQARFLE